MIKDIEVVFYGYRLTNPAWRPPSIPMLLEDYMEGIREEYKKYDITIIYMNSNDFLLDVGGYADLLNTVRLRCADKSIGNPCLGHVIGQSANCDLLEDIRRGISRMAFAPEMIEPDGSSKRVCHNCGCGC